MIASDSKGQLILTAWRALFKCRDADEAEAWACLEGLRLAAQWIKQPVIVESDCARMVHAMKEKEDRSAVSFILLEAGHQARMLSQWKVAKVKRECNLVANDLANLARRNTHTAVWLGRAPACVEDTLRKIVTLVTS